MIDRFRTVLLLPALFAAACSTTSPIPNSSQSAQFVERQTLAANRALENGELAHALTLLRSIESLEGNSEISSKIKPLERKIALQSQSAFEKGESAYQAGNRVSGDRWMQEALALRPGYPKALKALRESVSYQARKQQKEKLSNESNELEIAEQRRRDGVQQQMFDELYASGRFEEAIALADGGSPDFKRSNKASVIASYQKLASAAGQRNELDEQLAYLETALSLDTANKTVIEDIASLRVKLSERAYRAGLALMSNDLEAAISELESAVDFDPDNLAAKTKLNQAQTLKRNLERIQKR